MVYVVGGVCAGSREVRARKARQAMIRGVRMVKLLQGGTWIGCEQQGEDERELVERKAMIAGVS
jgi:hypothetical protein